MVEAQGYVLAPDGQLTVPENTILKTSVPSELVPHCPHCGRPMSMNLRADDTFVEDVGWHTAADRYSEFLRRHEGQRILFLELGVGYNTPGIIKYPFWRMTAKNPNAFYVCINQGQAICPPEIERQSVCIHADIGAIIAQFDPQEGWHRPALSLLPKFLIHIFLHSAESNVFSDFLLTQLVFVVTYPNNLI